MPRRPSRAPAAGASDHAAEVAELRRRALGGDLDDASALRLFLSHAGSSPAALPAMGDGHHPCPPMSKGGARRCDCVCGLVPPVGAWRRSGLWQKDLDALVRRAVGDDPRTLARRPRTPPAGLKNLGSTCYVNAALQCLFALPSFRASVFAMKPERDEENEANAGEEDEDPPRAKGGEGRRGLPRDESGGTRGAADDDSDDRRRRRGLENDDKDSDASTRVPRGPRRVSASFVRVSSSPATARSPTRLGSRTPWPSSPGRSRTAPSSSSSSSRTSSGGTSRRRRRPEKKNKKPPRAKPPRDRARPPRPTRATRRILARRITFRGVRRLALRRVAGVRHDVRSVRASSEASRRAVDFREIELNVSERSLRPPAREFRGRRGRRGRRRRGRRERRPRRGGRCGEKNR